MNPPQNPYTPPHSPVQDHLQPGMVRPRVVTLLACLYLATFPLFAWRFSLGGRMQIVVVAFWLTVIGLYVVAMAIALLKGKRWARLLVLGATAIWFCLLLIAIARGAGQSGAAVDLRGLIYVTEVLLKIAVAVLLLLPVSRRWFGRRAG